jgi:hypothetical protein
MRYPVLSLLVAVFGLVSPMIAIEFAVGGDISRYFLSILDSSPLFYLRCFIEGISAGWLVLLCSYTLFFFLLFIMPIISVLSCIILLFQKVWFYRVLGGILLVISSIFCFLLFCGIL